jgi:hypothetical protein
MTTNTLETKSGAEAAIYTVNAAVIDLQPGERYAGLVLTRDGGTSHHLILLPGTAEEVTWNEAQKWAATAGGEMPSRQEQALLYANLKDQFEPDWYWSSEKHELDGSYAWGQIFDSGNQDYDHKSYEGRARAVRRFVA